MQVTSRKDMLAVLDMLKACRDSSIVAAKSYANLMGHPAFKHESLPELLRAQEQNATALIVQAIKIWEFMLAEEPREDA